MASRPTLKVIWDEASRSQWTGLFSRIQDSCYMHTWAYGEAVKDMTKMVPRRGIIYRNGTPIGLVQAFQSRYLFNTCSMTKVLRGPLWFTAELSQDEQLHVLALMQSYFSKGLTNGYQILPELEDTPENRELMKVLGLRRALPGYATSYLDISQPSQYIRENFKESWRSALTFAENLGIRIEFTQEYHSVEWLLNKYDETMHAKGHSGPSAAFIRSYLKHTQQPYVLFKAADESAGILLVTHGLSATYLVGWSSKEAREQKVTHLLLWEAVQKLHNMGIDSVDLGGIDPKSAEGVAKFKEGVNGKHFQPVGMYVRI